MIINQGYIQKLIIDADITFYATKLAERNRVVLYNPEMESRRNSGDHNHILQVMKGARGRIENNL